MLYTYPHYYRKFQCIASECEDTCCAGWEIMIDDKALEKYKKAKGPVGNRLKNSINWKEGSFLQYHHRCAFMRPVYRDGTGQLMPHLPHVSPPCRGI